MAEDGAVLAIDIGGTKMAAGVADPDGRLITWTQVATPRDGDAEFLWRTLESLLVGVLKAAGVDDLAALSGIGCGCGGPMDWPAGLVSPLNIPAWRAFPLRERLAARFAGHGQAEVRVHNDAICMAIGEHWRGAGQGRRNVLGMVVSTGVGGGLILDNQLIEGASGNAGHIGHVVVYPDGPRCECSGIGCLEAVARGPALAAWAQAEGWRPDQPGVTAKDLAADATRGDAVAKAALRRAGLAIGIAIASATCLCDLEVVAVGGGVSQAGALLFDPLREALATHARLGFARNVQAVPTALGQTAGLVGAAALILAGDRYWAGD